MPDTIPKNRSKGPNFAKPASWYMGRGAGRAMQYKEIKKIIILCDKDCEENKHLDYSLK